MARRLLCLRDSRHQGSCALDSNVCAPPSHQTKGLAAELGPRGIRVNCVAPGIVPTKFSAALVETPELVGVARTVLGGRAQGDQAYVGGLVPSRKCGHAGPGWGSQLNNSPNGFVVYQHVGADEGANARDGVPRLGRRYPATLRAPWVGRDKGS